MSKIKFVFCLLLTLVIAHSSTGQTTDYETIRISTPQSRPESIRTHAFSPNGKYLALSFDTKINARQGVTVIDLDRMQIQRQHGKYFRPSSMAFSDDSRRIFTANRHVVLNKGEFRTIDVASGTVREVKDLTNEHGKIGIDFAVQNGKLVVTKVFPDFNPTIGDSIKVGDEILAIKRGPVSEYDRRPNRGWIKLTGKSREQAIESFDGPPDAWLRIQLTRKGSPKKRVASVQRQWRRQRVFPKSHAAVLKGYTHGSYSFTSANDLQYFAFVSPHDTPLGGADCLSDDLRLFAKVAPGIDDSKFVVEVHDLKTAKLVTSLQKTLPSYRQLRFSPDGKTLIVGTRNTIERYDLEKEEWLESVLLGKKEDRDEGKYVRRKISFGMGLPGDLYTTVREKVYFKPGFLKKFDISPDGTLLAVGDESGELYFYDTEARQRVAVAGEQILGSEPELLEYSPTGNHLVAFAEGVLHIFRWDAEANSVTNDLAE